MAKKRKKRRKSRRLFSGLIGKLWRFFVPSEIQSAIGWFWFGFSRLSAGLISLFLLLTFIFSALPVPFSAYMLQKKSEHCLIGQPYSLDYRWVAKEKMSWQIQMAVIAGEDQNFNNHFGVDWRAVEYALKANSKSNKIRGASTISQQTVKNLYLWHGSSWLRKGLELPMTLALEKIWDKRRILEVYLNIAEFGEGIFGVEAAAQHYFKKSAAALSLSEAALLAAALPNPHIFNVKKPSEAMRKRQAWIMQQVQNLGGKRYLDNL